MAIHQTIISRNLNRSLLEPLFDWIQRVDGHGVDHGDFLVVVFINDDHVEVLQVELDSLKMNQLHLVERHHERRL